MNTFGWPFLRRQKGRHRLGTIKPYFIKLYYASRHCFFCHGCMCMCIRVYGVSAWACEPMRAWTKASDRCQGYCPISINKHRLNYVPSKPPVIFLCLHPITLRLLARFFQASSPYMSAGDLNIGPQACTANILFLLLNHPSSPAVYFRKINCRFVPTLTRALSKFFQCHFLHHALCLSYFTNYHKYFKHFLLWFSP